MTPTLPLEGAAGLLAWRRFPLTISAHGHCHLSPHKPLGKWQLQPPWGMLSCVFVFEGPLMWAREGSTARTLHEPASNMPSKPGIIHPAILAWWTGALTLHGEGGSHGPGLAVRPFGLGVHLCDPGQISPHFPLQRRTPNLPPGASEDHPRKWQNWMINCNVPYKDYRTYGAEAVASF